MELSYIQRFENVVSLMRTIGDYTMVLVQGTVYLVVSDVEHFLSVGEYVKLSGVPCRVIEVIDWKKFTVDTFGLTVPLSGTWVSQAPYSDFGTKKTVNARLLEKSGGEYTYQKYPLIALRLPCPVSNVGVIGTTDANILIATFTRKQYKPEERIQNVYIPILYPLLEKFLLMTRMSGQFMGYDKDYTHIDRLFYGTESGDDQNIENVFSDPLDAVEIRNLKLTFINDNCV